MSDVPAGRGLKRLLRSVVLGALAPLGPLGRLAQGRRPVVLAYHDPSPATLAAHLAALSRTHTLVPLAAALDAVAAADLSALPPHPLAVTIDDGRAGNAQLAAVCRAAGVRPTVFACTRVTGRYWWSGIAPLEQRRLKQLPDEERRRLTAPAEGEPRESLTDEQIRALSADIDFQPHTRTHPVLPRCSDERAAEEIGGSRADLESLLGVSCDVFAYPNGDHGERDVAAVRAAGFRFALTTSPGLLAPGADPLRLPRVVVRDEAPAWEAVLRASLVPGRIQLLLPPGLRAALQVR